MSRRVSTDDYNRFAFMAPEVLSEYEDELVYWVRRYFRWRRDPALRAEMRGAIGRLRALRAVQADLLQRAQREAAPRSLSLEEFINRGRSAQAAVDAAVDAANDPARAAGGRSTERDS